MLWRSRCGAPLQLLLLLLVPPHLLARLEAVRRVHVRQRAREARAQAAALRTEAAPRAEDRLDLEQHRERYFLTLCTA